MFVALGLDADATVTAAAIALSGVAGRPVRAVGAEAGLRGAALTPESVERAAAAVAGEVDPADDVHATGAHRAALAGVLTGRLLSRFGRLGRSAR